ncbi:MAG: hypothetical protein ACPG6P_12555, partial [Akkermansiaceae bacterium]
MKDNLPTQITDNLRAVLKRVRRLQISRGILSVLTITLTAILIIMAVDFFFAPVPVLVRWLLFGALILALSSSFYQLFWKPLSRKIELLQVARWLEVRHPEIQERISTALELSGSDNQGISSSLLEEIIAEAETDVKAINPQIEVRARRVRAWLWPALGIAAVFALLFAIWPSQTGRLLVRAVAPFSQTGNAGAIAFDILPGDM